MSMNITITLPLDVIRSLQSAQTEATNNPDVNIACTTAAIAAVGQLPYKLQPHETTPRTIVPTPSTENKRPGAGVDDVHSISVTILRYGSSKIHQFNGRCSTRISSLFAFMEEETGIAYNDIRIAFGGKPLPTGGTLDEAGIKSGTKLHMYPTLRGS